MKVQLVAVLRQALSRLTGSFSLMASANYAQDGRGF